MRLIRHVKASNLLSFGPDGLDLELQDLNVLIGPNGSGKSNFLEVFELLKSLPRGEEDSNNLRGLISRGGGTNELFWKGGFFPYVSVQVLLTVEDIFLGYPLGHKFYINRLGFIEKESVRNPANEEHQSNVSTIYERNKYDRYSMFNFKTSKLEETKILPDFTLSILSQRLGNAYLSDLASTYERIRLYREWSFGRNTIFRTPQRADQRNDR
ncbi:MAG: AAA family ATPase, partial [Saprospiraceae bacterium]|nr:AAA family ATPase [Saprospiraceae bacterium]